MAAVVGIGTATADLRDVVVTVGGSTGRVLVNRTEQA